MGKGYRQYTSFVVDDNVVGTFTTITRNLEPKSLTRLLGLSGLGKTKLILGCFRPGNGMDIPSEITDKILYANINECRREDVIEKMKELIRVNNRKIIILDNCPVDLHERLIGYVTGDSSTLTLVTINSDLSEDARDIDTSGRTQIIKLSSRDFKPIVRKLLEENFNLTQDEINLIVESSNGLPQYAVLMAKNKEAIQQPGTLTNENLTQTLLGKIYTDAAKRNVILATSIFQRFGFIKDNESEYKAIALCNALCPLDIEDEEERVFFFKKVCEELKKRTILEDVGFSLSFRPTLLALKLAEDWWNNCTPAKFKTILPVLREHGLVESFCKQFKLLSYIENAKEIVEDLCDGVFKLAEVLNTEEGSRIFRSFVYVNPIACTQSLFSAFSDLSKEELEQISEGRRNLVWALEQLCYLGDTFSTAVKVMASFAVAENENIANNSYNQFLQLFHIYLPGTTVDLSERWEIIEDCIERGGDYFKLGISAAISALKSNSFMRMSGPIQNGPNLDYQPKRGEIWKYWSNAISLLARIASEHPERQTQIAAALLSNLFSLSVQGAGSLILPEIQKMSTNGTIHWLELRNTLKSILRSEKINDLTILGQLNDLLADVTPTDFLSRMQMYVIHPAYEDYRPKQDAVGIPSLQNNITELAKEFWYERSNWPSLFPLLATGNVAEGISFGSEVARQAKTIDEFISVVKLILDAMFKIAPDKRSVSTFIGLVRGFSEKSVIPEVFDMLISESISRPLLFTLVPNVDLPLPYLEKLIELVRSGEFPTRSLSCFNYGWGLKHLSQTEILLILKYISELDGGKAVAFSIAYSLSYDDPKMWENSRAFIRDLLLKNSEDVISSLHNSMDFYQWAEVNIKLLRETNDHELASVLVETIINQCNEWGSSFGMRNDFQHLLDTLQERYFDTLWAGLINLYTHLDDYAAAAFYLRDLLGAKDDTYRQTEGVIFGGGEAKMKIIAQWVKENSGINIYWLGEWLPVFPKDANGKSLWHPYALYFINTFGNRQGLLDGISANLATFSWTGSVIDRYETIQNMYRELLGHQIVEVRKWAKINAEYLQERIEQENNRELLMGF